MSERYKKWAFLRTTEMFHHHKKELFKGSYNLLVFNTKGYIAVDWAHFAASPSFYNDSWVGCTLCTSWLPGLVAFQLQAYNDKHLLRHNIFLKIYIWLYIWNTGWRIIIMLILFRMPQLANSVIIWQLDKN